MKWYVIGLVLLVVCVAWASTPPLKCPECKKDIEDGSYVCAKVVKGKLIHVCFKHGFEAEQKARIEVYKQLMRKK